MTKRLIAHASGESAPERLLRRREDHQTTDNNREEARRCMCPLTAKPCFGERCMWWVCYRDAYEDGECSMVVMTNAIRSLDDNGINTFEQNYSEEMAGIAEAVRGLDENGITTYEQNYPDD